MREYQVKQRAHDINQASRASRSIVAWQRLSLPWWKRLWYWLADNPAEDAA